MLVADTSALISLATTDVFETVLAEFEIHTTETVVQELEATATFADAHGTAATVVLEHIDRLTIHDRVDTSLESSRIDPGEASCLALEREIGAAFFLTDDLRALPELQAGSTATVAISPIVLRALVKRDALSDQEAAAQLDHVIETRGWLGTPIYRRAKRLFET